MGKQVDKQKPVFRLHAFDVLWNEVQGFPLDFDDDREVVTFLRAWKKYRRLSLVDGVDKETELHLCNVAVIEMEVFYE